VTVVIPVWGPYVAYLAGAVASVFRQRVDARVIVVDNAAAPRVRAPEGCEVVRSEVRLSRGEARNLGLAHVNSDYVVFLDADDLLVPGALRRLVTVLERRPESPAAVGRIIDPSGVVFRAPRGLAARLAGRRRLFAWLSAVWPLVPTQGCAVMRTAAVRAALGYGDTSYGEDWMLASCLTFRGPIAFDRAPALVYRCRHGDPLPSRRTRLDSAARVRTRLRADPLTGGGVSLAALAVAHVLAVLAAQPLARLRHRRTAERPELPRVARREELTPRLAS
jgi:glycosyltransferase involved in cell wall biosynthesis